MEKVNKMTLIQLLQNTKDSLEQVYKLDDTVYLQYVYDEIIRIDSGVHKEFVTTAIKFMKKVQASVDRLELITKHVVDFVFPINTILTNIITDIDTKPIAEYRDIVSNTIVVVERFTELIDDNSRINGFKNYESEIILRELNSVLNMCSILLYNEKFYRKCREMKLI